MMWKVLRMEYIPTKRRVHEVDSDQPRILKQKEPEFKVCLVEENHENVVYNVVLTKCVKDILRTRNLKLSYAKAASIYEALRNSDIKIQRRPFEIVNLEQIVLSAI